MSGAGGQTARGAVRAFSPFEWMVAGRSLRARRKDTFISVIVMLTMCGIAIGVAALIVVTSVMNGFRAELFAKIVGLNGHFSVYPIEQRFTDYEELVSQFESVDGVVAAIAFVEGQGLVSSAYASTGVAVRGISEADLNKLPLLRQGATLGGWDSWDASGGVALGFRLAQKLGVSIGDKVTLVTHDGPTTPFGSTPQIRSYPVSVIFDLGMAEFDSFYLYMPMRDAQSYFGKYEDVLREGMEQPGFDATDEQIDAAYERQYQATAAEIFLSDPDAVDRLRLPLQEATERPVVLTDWRQRNPAFFSAVQVERVVMFVILSLIVIVAAFNIISSLIMLVKDKGKDIAVLRTMGATRGAIMRIFCITGTTIGIVGTLAGVIMGLVLAINAEAIRAWLSNVIGIRLFPPEVFLLSELPSRVVAADVIVVVAMGLGLSLLATIYPAWRAAQYDPVEALRYE